MTKELTTTTSASKGLEAMLGNIEGIIASIQATDTPEAVNEIHTRVRVAREWARLQHAVEETREKLLRIELACWVRIYDLDGLAEAPKMYRSCMTFFAEHRDQVDEYIAQYPLAKTGRSLYKAILNKGDCIDAYLSGVKASHGLIDDNDRSSCYRHSDAVIECHNTISAVTHLLDHYGSNGESFSIAEMADQIIPEIRQAIGENNDTWEASYENGIREVCRAAVRSASIAFVGDLKAPRFVTYFNQGFNSPDRWLRIPFENARLWQLKQMIDLRVEQLRQDQAALLHLQDLYKALFEMANEDPDSDVVFQALLAESHGTALKDTI